MVQKPTSRRSKPTRKPVTLDLEATEVTEAPKTDETVPEAEPVAFEFGRPAEAEIEAAAAATSGAADAMDEAARGAVESSERPVDEKPADTAAPEPAMAAPPAANGRGLSALGGGILGGLVALLLAGGLQWAGIIPSLRTAPAPDLTPLQSQIDRLTSKVTSMEGAAPPAPGNLSDEVEAVRGVVDTHGQALATVQDDYAALKQRVDSLANAVSSGGAGEGAGLEALSGRIGDVETQLADLSAKLSVLEGGTSGVDAAALEAVRGEAGSAAQAAKDASDAIAGLKTEIGALQERVAGVEHDIQSGAGNRVAAAIAATALKSAADRGTGFMSELEAYASVSKDDAGVAALRDYAASGVPTLAQLTERFPSVANQIVAAASGVGPDAGIADRLMASARSLVKVRPVGEVEGDDPGAVAARMEVALHDGDLDRVTAEWDKLPEASKQASSGFMADLKARRELDRLISNVLTGAVKTGAPDAGQ